MDLQSKIIIPILAKQCVGVLLICCLNVFGVAQIPSSTVDSLSQQPISNSAVPSFVTPTYSTIDTSKINSDSTQYYSITYSKDSLDAPVEYNAEDSLIMDNKTHKIYLYGDAVVKYTTITLKADNIVLDWDSSIVVAQGLPDSVGRMAGFPEFQDGQQSFTAEKMRYNFKSRKGIVYDVTTQQGDINVLGERSKFVSKVGQDTMEREDVVYSENAIFTTCTHPVPHFGIRSRKQKVIPNKLVIIGSSNLEIMNVPTPLWLPFGFFPIASGRQTGLLFPSDYEYSDALGFGLREVGWFFPLGDHFNLALTADIYLKGSYRLHARSQYNKRYNYSGRFSLDFDRQRLENSFDGQVDPTNAFSFTWSHQQAATAHPYNRFGGNINIQTGDYQSRVLNSAQRVLQNQFRSNLTYSRTWADAPFNLTASFNHSQNNITNNVTISFPNVQFRTQTLYPLRRKNKAGKAKWYEDINFRYSNEIRNQFDAVDSSLFTQQTLEDARFGVRHDITGGTSFKAFKWFSVNPNFSYRETWYLNTITRENQLIEAFDTMTIVSSDGSAERIEIIDNSRDTTIENRINGFDRFYQMSAGASINTQIFNTLLLRKGWLRGIRHIMKPNIGFSFSPDYLQKDWFRSIPSLSNPDIENQYTIFDGGILGTPSASRQQMAITYGINNIFEAKVFSKRDSTEKKIKLFSNLRVSGSYNLAADTLKWSKITMSGTARFFKGATTVSIGGAWDPYILDEETGIRVNKFSYREGGPILRFEQARATISTRFTVEKIRAIFQGKEEEVVEDVRDFDNGGGRRQGRQRRQDEPEETDFLSLFENFNINHNLAFRLDRSRPNLDTLITSAHSIDISGSIKLTKNWDIRIGRIGYDFIRKSTTFPSLGFRRDLHCWQMGMDWFPTRRTYRFYIEVKPGSLGFLKVPYQRNNIDGQRAFN